MKIDGIESAAGALRYWERRQEVVTNNLANADTDGFRAERVFARLLGEQPVAQTATDTRPGSYRQTGSALDVAVGPNEFLVVRTPAGERWSRGGTWQIDPAGYLVDGDGNVALGQRGPVRVTHGPDGEPVVPDPLTIDRAGVVTAGGVVIDQLRVERSAADTPLEHTEGMRFVPPADRMAVPDAERDVQQGWLESSNVNPISALVDLVSIQRHYGFAQKVLTSLDAIRATIATDLTRPA